MRICFTMLSLALGFASVLALPASAQNSGVVFVGDMHSVDQAVLDAAELPLPSALSKSAPRPLTAGKPVPRDQQVRLAAALTRSASSRVTPAGFSAPIASQATAKQAESKKPSFFSRMKPAWLFGEASKKEPAPKDPFATATQQARIELTGAATKARSGVKRIPSYVAPKTTTANAGGAKKPSPATKPMTPAPKRGGGIVQRSTTAPRRGIFSGLFDGGDSSGAPAGSTPAMVKARNSSYGFAQASSYQPKRSTTAAKPSAPQQRTLAATRPQQPNKPAALANASGLKPLVPKAMAPKPRPLASRAAVAKASLPTLPTAAEPMDGVVFASDETNPAAKPSKAKGAQSVAAAPAVIETDKVVAAPKPPKLVPAYVEEKPAPTKPAKPLLVASDPKAVIATEVATSETLPLVEEPASEPTVDTFVTDEPLPIGTPYPMTSVVEVEEKPFFATDRFERIEAKPKAVAAEPTQRSIDLLAEAHQIAGYAGNADEFSLVVKHCRYVMAIDESQQAQAYAKQLAGWALTKRGDCLDDEGRHDEAEIDYREALSCDIECWRAEHALGVLASRKGEVAEAQRHFDRTIDLNPEFAKAYSNRAALAVHRGDYHRALDDFQTAIEINPDLSTAHTGRGRVCHMLGMLDEGLRHLDAAEILEPKDALIASGRADLLVDLGRYGQAAEAYDRAIRLDPNSPAPYRNLAWMQATCPVSSLRDGKLALANAEQAERLSGGVDDLTLDTKAAALAAMGRFDEASDVQRQAIEMAPPADAAAYAERLAMYEQGEAFTTQPIAVRQASYRSTHGTY